MNGNGGRRRRSVVLALVKVRVEGEAEQCHNGECFYAKSKA
ncbi:MAG: hypothetical protein QXL27_09685 [Candidatus Bathyarchaeia archaeon]